MYLNREEGRRVCWKELRTLGTSGEEIKEPTKWNKVFHWELGSERDSGVFVALDRDLRDFREVLGESTAIQSSRGKEIEWASQDPMILGGA
jgi:hypothetical protein